MAATPPSHPPELSAPLTLALVGNILALVFLGLFAIYMVFLTVLAGAVSGSPGLFTGIMVAVFAAFLALGVVGTVFGFRGRARILAGDVKGGSTSLIVGGALLILPAMAAGILLIVGGAIASSRAPAARNA